MIAFPLATPASVPEAFALIVRTSDDCQAKSAVTSLVDPSLKVAIAFSWVVLPMGTTGCVGLIAIDSNTGLAAATGHSAAAATAGVSFSVGLLEDLAVAAGFFTAAQAE